MNLEALVTRLATATLGTPGQSIFVNEMPSGCSAGILLLDAYAGTPVNAELEGYYRTEFRLIVRAVDYVAGQTLAKQASVVLKTRTGYVAATMAVSQCLALNLPRSYRRSVGGYWEFEVDFEIAFTDPEA